MSHLHKTVSCKAIIAAINRTLRPSSSSWINEAIEDIGWAIQGIGYHAGFEDFSTESPYLTVKHNRAKIPCEVERIKHVEWMVPVNSAGNQILNPDGTTPFPQESEEIDICSYKGIRLKLGSDSTNSSSDERTPRTTHISPGQSYYNLNSDYVVTSFESGYIKLYGTRFIIDKEGLPKVIDDFDYKTAVQWYIIQNMLFKGHKHPELNWKDAFQMWEMYRLRAENSCKVMGLDGADRLQNSWNRFATGVHIGDNFYMGMEQAELINK